MTKNKTNDFIKINNVKKYIKSNNWRNNSEFIESLKLKVKEIIDLEYKEKVKQIEDPIQNNQV